MRPQLPLAAVVAAALLAGCLPFKDDGVYACDTDNGKDCVTCDTATGWCRDVTAIKLGASSLAAISGAGTDAIFAGGANGVIVRWNGRRWVKQSTGTSKFISSIWAASPSDVFAVGGAWTWLHFDGGSWSTHRELSLWTWPPSSATDVTVQDFTAVGGFSDGGTGIVWALDTQGMVNWLVNDTSLDWPPTVQASDYWGLYGVIQDGMTPVAVTVYPDTSNWVNLWGAWADASLNSYFIGRHGAIVRDTAANTSWTTVDVLSTPDAAKKDLFGIWGESLTGNFISVGETGTVVFFNKGTDTATWTQATVSAVPVTADLFAVCATSETDVYAVGTGGLVLHWNGSAWSRITQPYQETLLNCYAVGSDLYAVTDQGAILHRHF
jgi:hypothetical protein